MAVLPFLNLSGDPAKEFFSDGVSEELLNDLANARNLRVAARTSSFAFKGKNEDIRKIAHALNVRSVLEGSGWRSRARLPPKRQHQAALLFRLRPVPVLGGARPL